MCGDGSVRWRTDRATDRSYNVSILMTHDASGVAGLNEMTP